MRLPNKQDHASRSMASTMRKPVLEQNRIAHRAAVQRFTPMPTNYDDVGRAQGRAALASIEVWNQVGKLGTQIAAIDQEHQKTALAAKKARLVEFASTYYSSAAMEDLNENVEGTLSKKHRFVSSDFQSALADKLEELDEEFVITDPELKSMWANAKLGIVSETQNNLNSLIDRARDQEAKDNAEIEFNGINTKDEFTVWSEEFGEKWWSPMQLEKMRIAKFHQIEINGVNAHVNTAPEFGSNGHIREYLNGEEERLANGQLEVETFNSIRSILAQKMQENSNEALRAIGSADPSEIEDITQFHIDMGNIADAHQAKKIAENRVQESIIDGFSADVDKAISIARDGDVDSAFGLLTLSTSETNWERLDPAQREAALSRRDDAIAGILSFGIKDYLDTLNITSTRQVEKDGVIVEEVVTKGTAATEELLRLRQDMANNPEKYGIANDDDMMFAINDIMAKVETVVAGYQQAEVNNQKQRDQISERTRRIYTYSTNPSLMNSLNFGNYSEDEKRGMAQEVFERWLQNEKAEAIASREAETNQYLQGRVPVGIYSEHDYARQFLFESGFAPPGYIDQLTAIVTKPSMYGVGDATTAAAQLMTMMAVNPAITEQEGLNQDGLILALEAAQYAKLTGDPSGVTAYIEDLQKQQRDPNGYKERRDRALAGMKAGDVFDQQYKLIAEESKWMPETIPAYMRKEIEAALGPMVGRTWSNEVAMRLAFNAVSANYGVEMMPNSETGEDEPTWVYRSIYRHHKHASASPASPAVQVQAEGGTNLENDQQFMLRESSNNVVAMTLADIAKENGLDPTQIRAMWIGPEGLTPEFRNNSELAKGGWLITDMAGTPIPAYSVWAKDGQMGYIYMTADQLSPRAAERQQYYEATQKYEAHKSAYEEWSKHLSVTSDGGSWGANLVNGAVRWFQDDDKQLKLSITVTPYSKEEEKELARYSQLLASSEPNSLEAFVNSHMLKLLKSQPYRAAHLGRTDLDNRQKLIDLMKQTTMQVATDWWHSIQARAEGKTLMDKHYGQETPGFPEDRSPAPITPDAA